MTKPAILCVDDQRDVLAALLKDLEPLGKYFDVVDTESADEAMQVLEDFDAAGQPVALVISDHVMPGESGVEFLTTISRQKRFTNTRKLLLTGLATHDDTIRAINDAHIDGYIAKPWEAEELLAQVKQLVTHFIFDKFPDSYPQYQPVLDSDVMFKRLQQRGGP